MSDIVIQMAQVRPHSASSVGCDGLARYYEFTIGDYEGYKCPE